MYNMTSEVDCPSFEEVLVKTDQGAKSMLVVSGGLDSAYVLWKYAQHSKDILCHHVQFDKNYSKRYLAEKAAVDNQISYLREKGINIELLVSSTETPEDRPAVRDWYAAVILSLNHAFKRGVSYIVVGDDLPDSYIRAQSFSKIPEKYKKEIYHLNQFVKSYTFDRCQICTANEANNLSELYNEMPEDYIKLIFSCREPYSINNIRQACGKCHSCSKNYYFGWQKRIANTVEVR